MSYKEFIETLMVKIQKERRDVYVQRHSATKNNGVVREGLMLQKNESLTPVIYLEEFYSQYLNGTDISEIIHTILEIYEKSKVTRPIHFEEILSYEKIKEKIVCKLINMDNNKELLKRIPYKEYFDLAIVFYVLLENTAYGTATLLITEEHLKMWNVSREDVYQKATENTPELLPMHFFSLMDSMYVLTNTTANLGASTILYPGTLMKIADELDDNFYILPSSTHELIILPERYGVNRLQLEIMVEEINETEIEAEDILSNTVYYYSRKEGRIIL